MTYFEIKVHAQSKEELEKRVVDNEKRGFEVARYYEFESERTYATNTKYVTADGSLTRARIGSVNKTYGAVMRRKQLDPGQREKTYSVG